MISLHVGDLGRIRSRSGVHPSVRPINPQFLSQPLSITPEDLLMIVGITYSEHDRYVYVLASSGAMGWIPSKFFRFL